VGLDFPKAKSSVFQIIGRPEPSYEERDIEATYDYTNAEGEVSYQVVRKFGKKFMQRRPDRTGGWVWGLGKTEPLPYHLHKWRESKFVAIVEGEKDVHTLEGLEMVATCNNGGAGNFKPELAQWFTGKKVAIFADNDDPGRDHAQKVAAILKPVATSVKIIEIPDLPAKGDVTDFVRAGGTKDRLKEIYAKAQEWTPEWEFGSQIPEEDDKYVRNLRTLIEECGSLDRFWDMRSIRGLPTPWGTVTRSMAGGLRPGEVYVIGGNQGSGKTSLMLQFLTNLNRAKYGVLLFSMEMGWADVFQRICAAEARVNLLEYRELQSRGSLSDLEKREYQEQRLRLIQATTEMTSHSLLISKKPRVTTEYLLAESRRLAKRNKIDLVAIDHMQLMGSSGSVKGDYEKMTGISRMTKEVAVELNVPVLLVSQTSRANNQRSSELEVSDLRGSGAIEEDAAAVFLVYPDEQDRKQRLVDGTYPYQCKSWLKKGKDRFGLQGTFTPLMHSKIYTRFDLYTEE
jgi:replicative DNA helicase